ncbi:GTP cyclohydrolase I FolE [Companilactobacillus sp.]|jgi:GTP cyclohydrolase I|uniref:GTP cyclohydrolase I FolE n=1 Tax=Companilactobacillus sp. TaxID=2767905 RepID=UPI0025BD0267|nr:GTP cyclohydrolase I FolE [Companilactobacillus sp.]MCH4009578.1 GTP cyclohydrolase I FolE [Companilactobacillus sp.]MCH4052746.1 GTP cyclohydrolase I FolE [Companilactobacillus sp.]MCH4077520.1 GTP cyclohydrolase I FolE [Companilactobacillus sp.]MCH4126096.1 GTP cyclohydrolase I FolE [Companilactobacillus sp.]MCI1311804.1 GTP cyclohydrolase I FolE [Companilactobacillus sp.]
MSPENKQIIEDSVKNILKAVGDDPNREGLIETPARVARMYAEVFSSLDQKEFTDSKVFHTTDLVNGENVIVKDIPFYSMCEHHLLPFFGTVTVGYEPKDGKIIGLSKIPRLVDFVARKPSVQENITSQIGTKLNELLSPQGVAVIVTARHMCVEMRGVQKTNSQTTTTFYSGVFRDKDKKMEFLQEVKYN